MRGDVDQFAISKRVVTSPAFSLFIFVMNMIVNDEFLD